MMIIAQYGMTAISSEKIVELEITKVASAEKHELVATFRMNESSYTKRTVGRYADPETAKLALSYIAFCISVGSETPFNVPDETKMRAVSAQKKRMSAESCDTIEELLRSVFKEGPKC